MLEIEKPKPIPRKSAGAAVVLGIFGGLIGTIVVIGGSWYASKHWNIIMNYLIKIRYNH